MPPPAPLQSMEARLREEVAFLKDANAALTTRLEEIADQPCQLARIVQVERDNVLLMVGGTVLEVRRPSGLRLADGDAVAVNPKMLQIIRTARAPILGAVSTVLTVLDDRHAEIQEDPRGGTRVVRYNKRLRPKAGDRVIADATFLLRNLGKKEVAKYAVDAATGITWDDVVGLADAKRKLREAIEGQFKHAATYKRHKKKLVKGALLYGPPGNGKTLLAKAAATALAELHGKTPSTSGFQFVSGPEVLNLFVGNSEAAVRGIFDAARAHFAEHGYPGIICLDEADALLSRRGARSGIEGMEKTIVPQFLSEMDGLRASSAFVIILTNRQDTIDPAVMRDGRCDIKIEVQRPPLADVVTIARGALQGKPLAEGESDLASFVADRLFAEDNVLARVTCKDPKNDRRFLLRHLVSGAMAAGVVERASQIAIRREIDGGKETDLTRDDVVAAVAEVLAEQRALEHPEEFGAFIAAHKLKDIVGVEPVRSA